MPLGVSPGRPAGRFRASGSRVRHLAAHVLIALWLLLALLAAGVQQTLPVARWLAVHLFLLGGAGTAILVWSEHFAVALLHAPPPGRRASDARLAGFTAAVTGVLAGVWADVPVLTGAACALLVAVVTAHLVMLVRLGRGALGGRLAPVVPYYRAAAVALIAGAVLGWLLATGGAGPQRYAGLRLAHLHVTLLGWIGLPVLGTLFMLWPTVLGVRMADRTARVARRAFLLTACGLPVAVAALAAGVRPAAVAGLACYTAGVALAVGLFARTPRKQRPVSPAAVWMLAASVAWLCAAVAADLVLLALRPPDEAGDAVAALVPVLLAGFVGQVLIGALTYLLPVVLGAGPADRAALRAVLERGWTWRLAVLNTGVALAALPLPAPAATTGALLAAAAGTAFLALAAPVLVRAARTVLGDLRAGDDPAGRARRAARRPALWGTAAGAALVLLGALVANSGGDNGGTDLATGTGTGAAAVTRTVDVTLGDMRIRPARVEVARGTALTLRITNADDQRHDLKVEGGPATPLLAPGGRRTLDLGRITSDRTAYCTLPGHRAAGMTLDITVGAASGDGSGDGSAHTGHTTAGTTPDLSADFSGTWRPRAAELAPAPEGTVHRVELRARRTRAEVAPGTVQERWTFGGTAPGPTLRGRVGDVFEITLVNDDTMGHGIDFHAGALAPDRPMRTLDPGERLTYRFRAERAGAWLYHCSTAPMLQHLANGMYGAVVVDPPGLAEADREYLLVSSELYLGTPGGTAQVAKLREHAPDAWMFNGVAAQYAHRPLTARAGERARFWVVAAGPADGVAFHLVGTVFDTVYKEGAYLLRPGDPGGSQALDLAPAQGGFVETVFPEAGHYSFVDHDMRHAESGAHGTVEVTGR
ncbi:multicopper oxidase domain-containing protein [Streptomyces tagetis]|uniref:Copper-containing nitrite reductase n=1 Tax=Streptomyces tagetis TaxID=2820809 RepID=A0A941AY74_9ACTN|nr:multicopper oxidase domain-containing protein [Streptomyces sp. RG38]MBQ0827094.1 multicopper oxidase domain-containing protein [Streptomyces sp. RG38]